jgi:hypothetical protein
MFLLVICITSLSEGGRVRWEKLRVCRENGFRLSSEEGDNSCRRKKLTKSKGGGVSLVVGGDLCVEQIGDLVGKTIVGIFSERRISMSKLCQCISRVWRLVLGYDLIAHDLSGGWIGFILHNKENARRVLARFWLLDNGFLRLKPWHPLFDIRVAVDSSSPTWVNLPNIPLEF